MIKLDEFFDSDSQVVIIIVGVQGSGKTTLMNYLCDNPFKKFYGYDSWLKCFLTGNGKPTFVSDCRYQEFKEVLMGNNSVILSGIFFCNDVNLSDTISEINKIKEDIKIVKLYLEKNLDHSINNIKIRDFEKGGEWIEDKNGNYLYKGNIFKGIPDFAHKIKTSKKLVNDYEIPITAKTIKVKKIDGVIPEQYNSFL